MIQFEIFLFHFQDEEKEKIPCSECIEGSGKYKGHKGRHMIRLPDSPASKRKYTTKKEVVEINDEDEDEDEDPYANTLEGFTRREKQNLIKKLDQTYDLISTVYARQNRMIERVNGMDKVVKKIAQVFKLK